jgi:hypothetical protein
LLLDVAGAVEALPDLPAAISAASSSALASQVKTAADSPTVPQSANFFTSGRDLPATENRFVF